MAQAGGEKIGFIGLGSMGKAMATNISKAGFSLTVYDIRKEPLAEMEKIGVKVAKSTKELGQQCDTIVVMVLNYPQIKEVVFPPEGVLGGMKNGSTLIITSTISPLEMVEVEKVASKSGVAVMDSPVSGGHERAIEGTLVLMAGAEEKVFKENEPLLKAMGKHIYYTGGVGKGQTVKMINQLLVGAHQVAAAEALVMAKKLGMDLNVLHNIISNSLGDSAIWRMFGPRMIDRDFEPRGAINTMTKDLRAIMQTAVDLGTPILVSSITYQVLNMADSRGLAEKDCAALITIFEDYAGIKMSD
jgi:3-hydroxyisobutyrate dehydrogenase-like beta-hydroxyacid dehydrogenase